MSQFDFDTFFNIVKHRETAPKLVLLDNFAN